MFSFQGFKDILTKVEKRLEDYKPKDVLATSLDKAKVLTVPHHRQNKNLLIDDMKEVSNPFEDLLSESVPEAHYKANVDLTAGLPLIEKYEIALKIIHENNVTLAARAEATDKLIFPAVSHVNDEANAVIQLQKSLENLPAIQSELEAVKKSIQSLAEDFSAVERLLDSHILAQHQSQTAQLKERLSADIDKHHLAQMRQLASERNEQLISAHQRTLNDRRAAELAAQKELDKEQQILEAARQRLRAQEAEAKRQFDAESAKKREEYDRLARAQLEQYKQRELEAHNKLQLALKQQQKQIEEADDPFAAFGSGISSNNAAVEDPFAFGSVKRSSTAGTTASLEVIRLDTDRSELDAFLETPPTSASDTTSSAPSVAPVNK